jgi:integrase
MNVAKSAGVERVTFHTLRHSSVSFALAAGVSAKIIAERVGHASAAFTLDAYAHVTEDMQDSAAEALDAFVHRPKAVGA